MSVLVFLIHAMQSRNCYHVMYICMPIRMNVYVRLLSDLTPVGGFLCLQPCMYMYIL